MKEKPATEINHVHNAISLFVIGLTYLLFLFFPISSKSKPATYSAVTGPGILQLCSPAKGFVRPHCSSATWKSHFSTASVRGRIGTSSPSSSLSSSSSNPATHTKAFFLSSTTFLRASTILSPDPSSSSLLDSPPLSSSLSELYSIAESVTFPRQIYSFTFLRPPDKK